MGSAQSDIESNDRKAQDLFVQIEDIGNQIVGDAISNGWDRTDPTLCSRIAVIQKQDLGKLQVDLLARIADIYGIKDVNFGLVPAVPGRTVETLREYLCSALIQYFLTKVDIAEYLLLYLRSDCQELEIQIRTNMPVLLNGTSRQTQEEATKRLVQLSKSIADWYKKISDYLNRLLQFITLDDLDRLAKDIQTTYTQGYTNCCQYIDDLRDFLWEPVVDPESNTVYYYNKPLDMSVWYLYEYNDLLKKRGLQPIRKKGEFTCEPADILGYARGYEQNGTIPPGYIY